MAGSAIDPTGASQSVAEANVPGGPTQAAREHCDCPVREDRVTFARLTGITSPGARSRTKITLSDRGLCQRTPISMSAGDRQEGNAMKCPRRLARLVCGVVLTPFVTWVLVLTLVPTDCTRDRLVA